MARALALACHPLPTVAVTAISAGLAALAGLGLERGLLLVTAILAGQLSIGWSNDSIDAARDLATDRRDKPVARGTITTRTVGIAAVLALVGCVIASLALGWAAGLASIVVAASGWAYNLARRRHPRAAGAELAGALGDDQRGPVRGVRSPGQRAAGSHRRCRDRGPRLPAPAGRAGSESAAKCEASLAKSAEKPRCLTDSCDLGNT